MLSLALHPDAVGLISSKIIYAVTFCSALSALVLGLKRGQKSA